MKKVVATLLLFTAISFLAGTEVMAQENSRTEYHYADSKSGIIYQLFIEFKGYQVSIWVKNNKQAKWSACKVVNTNNEVLTYSLNGTTYHAKLDPNNSDAVVVYSGDYKTKWKYYKKQ